MRITLKKLLKWLVYTGAAGIMLLALLVGIARLFLPVVPEYQDDIRRWAAQAIGFDVQFENISASWPFAGPELHFIDVTVSSQETGEKIFFADNLTVGISLLMLLRDRRAMLSRLGIEGSRLRVHRDAAGKFLFQDRSLDEFLQLEFDPDRPLRLPDLLIELSGIEVSYADETRAGDVYTFGVEQLELQLSDEQIVIDGEIELAPEFGGRVMVATDIPTRLLRSESVASRQVAGEWRLFVGGEDLKLEKILAYALNRDLPVTDVYGDVTVSAAFNNRTLQNFTADLDLVDVVLHVDPSRIERYEVLAGRLEWERDGEAGWLLAATDIDVERRNLFTQRSDFAIAVQPATLGRPLSVRANALFLRLQDLYPLLRVADNESLLANVMPEDLQLPRDVYGVVQNFDFSLNGTDNEPVEVSAKFQFSDIGIVGMMAGNSIRGISGGLTMDKSGGRLHIEGQDAEIAWPALFTAPIEIQSASGLAIWRVDEEGVHITSDDVQIRLPFVEGDMHFALDWPGNGDSPRLDLTATGSASDVRHVVPLLPLNKLKASVTGWLDRAIIAGQIPRANIEFNGPLREFPFDAGEGVFHIDFDVEQGALDYAAHWPRIDDISARLVFDGVSLTTQSNSGRLGRIGFRNADVRIADLRKGRLEISTQQLIAVDSGLHFLQQSPVADAVGPILGKLTGAGTVDATLQLAVPIAHPSDYELELNLQANGADLGMTSLDWGLTDLNGRVTVRNTQFFATGMTGTLLGEPVTLDLRPATESSDLYDQFIKISGRTPVERWMKTLSLPFVDRIDGPVDWNALVLIPRREAEVRPPVHLVVRSDLLGAESRLPDPLAKSAADTRALELDIAFRGDDRLELFGRMHQELTWAFDLEFVGQTWQIARGAVHAGSAPAIVPIDRGVELSGRLKFLRFDDWLTLTDDEPAGDGSGQADWQEIWREAIVDVEQLSAFGQVFSDVELEARHDGVDWQIDLEGPAVSGRLMVPLDLEAGRPIAANMARLWLVETESGNEGSEDDPADPRLVPPMQVEVDDFVIDDMSFGSMSATVQNILGGVLVDPIKMQAPTFTIEGDGAWLVHPNDATLRQSHLALKLVGTDIEAVLTALGYDPVIGGESVSAQGDLTWLGGPSDDFLQRADGTFSIKMKKGSLLAVEPGGGRILGVLSLAALPRRLSFDFSDVFSDGLSFDTLKGDFTVDDGNAYTCNLGLEGSVADMGVVGRAGIEARDYDQLAVVRPHVSHLLAVGGVVVGGPVVGAAMLLFSQIFHKPLSTLGESYYRIKGSWDDPQIEQIRGNDLDVAPLRNCDEYLSDAITESLKK